MVKRTLKRFSAFAMAAVIGFAGVMNYNGFADSGLSVSKAAEADRVVFAQGAGTGADFSATKWSFTGKEKDGATVTGTGRAPGIEADNKYLKDGKSVIRLINGVKRKGTDGLEADDSYTAYRSGEAFLSDGIKMDTTTKFSVKFTFSMPEAVVNTSSAGSGGDQYAREVGGDGIAFVMTTEPHHEVQAGSGIGYQGIGNSVAVELDSYFNGAYYMGEETVGSVSYTNWDFDNQLFFHEDGTCGHSEWYPDSTNPYAGFGGDTSKKYTNYQNYNFAERFDHVAITKNGDVKKHIAKSYINGLDPTELSADNKYVNLAYDKTTTTNTESTDKNCATRFADKNVDDRLFTVWIDYDGSKMNVSYANGDFANAQKPATPQIKDQAIDLSLFNDQTVYMGFTSAVGSSKANHTIHSFQFVNRYDASYKLNYYWKNPTTGDYEKKAESDVFTGEVGDSVTATDVDAGYVNKYDTDKYTLSTVKTQETSVELTDAGETYEMNVYYDPIPENPKYQLKYWWKDKATGQYVEKDSTSVEEGNIGDVKTAVGVDPAYKDKYKSEHYVLSTTKTQEDTKTLSEAGKTYVMNVYYDPEEASYKLNYHVYDPDTGQYEYRESTSTFTGYVGDNKAVGDADPNYGTKYDNYIVNTQKNETYNVTLSEVGKTYEMDVYYDPAKAGYKLNYYKLDPNTNQYVYQESTDVKDGEKDQTYTPSDADANYEGKYTSDGYTYNDTKTKEVGKDSVTITDTTKTYEMNVYYDPPKATYKTEYYLQNPDGSYTLKDTVPGGDTYAGKDVTADIKTYDGYKHVTTQDSVETEVVKQDNSTTMKVYYNYAKDPAYKVEYYVQQEDGSYKLYTETPDISAKTGDTVTAEIITINGYVHTTTDNTKETDKVLADGSTVLKVYYNLVPKQEPTTQAPTTQEPVTEAPTTTEEDEEWEDDEEYEDDEEEPEKKTTKSAKTGDETNLGFLLIIMLSAVTGGVVCLYVRKKEKE